MKRLDIIICVLLLAFAQSAVAQNKSVTKANKLYKEQQYAEAIPYFEEAVAETPSLSMRTKLAFCYKATNQLELAEAQYATLVYDDKVRPISFKHYAETLMSSGKYAAAKFWLDEYIKKKPDDVQAKVMLKSCDEIYNIKPYFLDAEVKDYAFNSGFDDNAAVIIKDRIYFTSDQGLKGKTNSEGRGYMGIYESVKDGSNWTEPTKLGGKFNTANNNSGPVSFTKDGQTAIFCKNAPVPNKKGEYPLQIFMATAEDGKWKNFDRVPFCKIDINYFQAAIAPDGKMIVYSSNQGGGEGKADLYSTVWQGEKWSRPVNLGASINTGESEGFPFIDEEGKLYFCSKGHLGFGGYDLYLSEQNSSGQWTEPVNLGFPINSSGDEMSFFLNEDKQSGIFSSTRNEGNDDLFFFGPESEDLAVEEDIPDFAKEGFAKREADLKRAKEEAIAKAEAEEKARVEAKAKKLAAAEAEAAAKKIAEAERKTTAVEPTEIVQAENPVETKIERSKEMTTINDQQEIANVSAGDTLYVGKKMEEVAVAEVGEKISKKTKKIKNKKKAAKTAVAVKEKVQDSQLPSKPEVVMEEVKTPEVPTSNIPVAEVQTPKVETPKVETPAVTIPVTDVEEKVAEINPTEKVKIDAIEAVRTPTNSAPPITEVEVETPATPELKVVETETPVSEIAVDAQAAAALTKAEKKALKKANKAKEKVEVPTEVVAIPTPKIEEEVLETVVEKPQIETPVVAEVEKKINKAPAKVKKEVAEVVLNKPSGINKNIPATAEKLKNTGINKIASLKSDLSGGNTAGKKYTLEDLKYTFNATAITPDLEPPLIDLAELLQANPAMKIRLIGHTGSIGGDEKNQRLSIARAAAAVDFLISKGADPAQLSYDGRGETEIINGCHDGVLCGRAQHQANERIEIEVQ